MKTPNYRHWYRLCVDVDHEGNLLGRSYEVRLVDVDQPDDAHRSLVVLPQPGPFATLGDAIDYVWRDIEHNYGVQLKAF